MGPILRLQRDKQTVRQTEREGGGGQQINMQGTVFFFALFAPLTVSAKANSPCPPVPAVLQKCSRTSLCYDELVPSPRLDPAPGVG